MKKREEDGCEGRTGGRGDDGGRESSGRASASLQCVLEK